MQTHSVQGLIMQCPGVLERLDIRPALVLSAFRDVAGWRNPCWSTGRDAALRIPGGSFFCGSTLQPYRKQFGTRRLGERICCAEAGEPSESEEEFDPPQSLQVPEAWTSPDVAAQESEWLRGALHQWLDDEYCPEPANVEISKRCASVFYYCLLEKQLEIGDILMQMVSNLETFSFKESFHGSFSSANAAVDLITKRMGALEHS